MDRKSMNLRNPKFSKTLEARMSHLKSLMEIYHWQNEQGRRFLHEDPHLSWSQSTEALRTLEWSSSDEDKAICTFVTGCRPFGEELELC